MAKFKFIELKKVLEAFKEETDPKKKEKILADHMKSIRKEYNVGTHLFRQLQDYHSNLAELMKYLNKNNADGVDKLSDELLPVSEDIEKDLKEFIDSLED